jgi:hypothetical protein
MTSTPATETLRTQSWLTTDKKDEHGFIKVCEQKKVFEDSSTTLRMTNLEMGSVHSVLSSFLTKMDEKADFIAIKFIPHYKCQFR